MAKGFPNPSCPHCKGSGDLEVWWKGQDSSGRELVHIDFSPCECTYQGRELETKDDWTGASR